jgi:hypothetical protein
MERPSASPLRKRLEHLHRAYGRALVARHSLRALARIAIAIAVTVALGVLIPTAERGAWVRLSFLILAAAGLLLVTLVSFGRARRTLDAWLEEAETAFPAIRSWLRNALELERRPAEHTSKDLTAALAAETGRRVQDVPLARLRPPVAPGRPLIAVTAALLTVLALGLLWPNRTARSWQTLWVPASAAPPVRLAVEPGSVTVSPGASLTVRAKVWGTPEPPRLWLERHGEPDPVAEGTGTDGARVWRFDLTQLTREQDYKVRVMRTESSRYEIRFTGEPTAVGFEIEYRAPDYARLPVQRGAAPRGDLTALRGTHANVTVTFDRDLERLTGQLPGGAAMAWKEITPRRWQAEALIDREGEYQLTAEARPSEASRGRTAVSRYRITPLADAPPVIAVRLPSGDMDLPVGQRVPVEVFAQDDLGLSELRLESRKDPTKPWRPVPLAQFGARPREAQVSSTWDASPLGLLPGEVGTFRFVVYDDNAITGRGMAVSPTFELRFPSLAEMYSNVGERQEDAQTALEKAQQQANELQKSLDKLARQQTSRSPSETPQSVQRSEEMKSALERQQQIGQKLDEASRQLQESIAQAAERQAFDQQLMRKLSEMQNLMQQIQSQDLKDAMKKMQEAMEAMDRQRAEQALPEMRQQNQEMIKNLERTIELLKKLREEERVASLAQRAKELKAQQDQLNREHQDPAKSEEKNDAASRAERQEKAAQESEQLAKEAREKNDQSSEATPEAMQKAAEKLEQQAAKEQRKASESAAKNQNQQAKQQGEKASEQLEQAAEQLSSAAQAMSEQQEQVDLAAVRRAAQDLVSLQRSAEQNMDTQQPQGEQADRQNDLSEGAARVADSLNTLAARSPFLSPKLVQSLGKAINSLQQSSKDLASGNRSRGEQSGRSGSQSLNEAVLELRQTEQSMCNKPGTGQAGGRNNPQRMGEMGQRQGQLNKETQRLSQKLSNQMRMSTGDQAEMRRLSEEQRRIREQVEQIAREDQQKKELLGRLDQTQREMKEVEEALGSGQSMGDVEEKQTRILSRLLDASRSVNRRDFEPQRESAPGQDIVRASPGELPAELLRENDRLRLDLLKAEADRYPTRYRAYVEAYLRSLNGSRR